MYFKDTTRNNNLFNRIGSIKKNGCVFCLLPFDLRSGVLTVEVNLEAMCSGIEITLLSSRFVYDGFLKQTTGNTYIVLIEDSH